MALLDFYKSRFGNAVKHQGNGWNGPCPLCGGEPGRSDRFVVWPDRDENLGKACAEHGVKGIWSCRQCGGGGDTIAYLMQIDGLDFKAALAELGIEGGRSGHRRRPAPAEPRRESDAFTPRPCPAPSQEWQIYAAKLLDEATTAIDKQPKALEWLAGRGISAEAVKNYRIGYLPAEGSKYPGRWRARAALGLSPKTDGSGKAHDKIFIPRGIVIPTFAPDGAILNLRIRRHKADLKLMPNGKPPPKYMELEGSCTAPLFLRATGSAELAAYCVTEAELDAILIHHATDGVVGGIAVRTNRGKPDSHAHTLLRQAVKICIALDFDEAGGIGVPWWERTYPQAVRWPTPEGKDPGDAFRLGVDIREWVAAALPDTVKLSTDSRETSISHMQASGEDTWQNGQLGIFVAGQNDVGGKGAEKDRPEKKEGADGMRASVDGAAQLREAGFTADEAWALCSAIPKDFATAPRAFFPVEVLRAWLLWRNMPVSIRFTHDADGNCTGFGWDINYAWRAKKPEHQERFEAFFSYQDKCKVLWEWFSAHPDEEISWQNLLHLWR